MPNDADAPRRRRGAVLEDALLRAAWAELRAVGYQDLTYEAVAARAGTSRTVLYRRWPHRRDLVLAALGWQAPPLRPPEPDTGALRTDVLALLTRVAARMTELSPVLAALADSRTNDGDLAEYLEERTRRAGAEAMAALLDRAAERGELVSGRVPDRVAAMPFTLIVGETLITHRAPGRRAITEVVDQLFLPLIAHHAGGAGAA